jgi:hypothetical protein
VLLGLGQLLVEEIGDDVVAVPGVDELGLAGGVDLRVFSRSPIADEADCSDDESPLSTPAISLLTVPSKAIADLRASSCSFFSSSSCISRLMSDFTSET